MNTLTKSPASPILIISLLSLMAALAVSHLSATAQGNGVNGEEFIFGSVGITATQTARLNVVNTATDGRTHTRVLKFLDSTGNVIVTKTVTLAPGQSDFLDLNGAALGGARVQIRAVDPTCPGCNVHLAFGIIQTLELIDNVTSQTEVLYAPAQFAPQGPPNSPLPFGMIGVTTGQTLRINVSSPPNASIPTDPIRVLLSFARSDGQLITNADGHPLQPILIVLPGQSASFDISADLILTGPRTEIRPVVRPEGPPGRLISTVEVINDATGKTAVFYAPVARACGAN